MAASAVILDTEDHIDDGARDIKLIMILNWTFKCCNPKFREVFLTIVSQFQMQMNDEKY